jgi:hypothetical protein
MLGDKTISGQTLDSRLEEFFNFCPAWKSPAEHEKIHLFWEKYPDYPFLKVLRFQKEFRLCSVQAGVVLQHYLATIAAGENENLGMVDIAKYLRNSLDGEKLMLLMKDELSIPARRFFQEDLCQLKNPADIVIFNIQIPYSEEERTIVAHMEFVKREDILILEML